MSRFILLFFALALLLGQQTAFAQSPTCFATHDDGTTVFSSADATAVQQAVDAANPSTIVRVAGTCTGTQTTNGTPQLLYVNKTLSIYGGYDGVNWQQPISDTAQSTLDAAEGGRVVYVDNADLFMVSFNMINGSIQADGGGVYATGSQLGLSNVTVRDNDTGSNDSAAGGRGGGVFIHNGSVDLYDSLVTKNQSTNNDGGGIAAENATINVTRGEVSHNFAQYGEGGGIFGDGNVTIISAEIHHNSTLFADGGGISSSGVLTVLGGALTENRAVEGSGGAVFSTGQFIIDSTQILSNTARYAGGSILHARGDGTLEDVTMRNGNGESSGHIDNSGTLTVRGSTISGGNSTFGAGAIHNMGTLTIEETTITASRSLENAGGIYNSGSLIMRGSTIHDIEVAATVGRGALLNAGSAEISNSTISNNGSSSAPAHVGIYNSGSITLTNATISDNSATSQNGQPVDGVGFHNVGTATLINTLIANSSGGSDCAGAVTLTNTLIEDGTCGATLTGDPALGALADNGGATQTHALLDGSSAINAGNNAQCPIDDQRGEARDDGACDIGAFEVQSDAPPPAATCYATHNDGVTVYETQDASAIRTAIFNATAGGTVKIAGTCVGGVADGAENLLSINEPLTLHGGYANGQWTTPSGYTTIDANGEGRVIRATEHVNLAQLIVRGGVADDYGAGLDSYKLSGPIGGGFTLTDVQVIDNTLRSGSQAGGGAGIAVRLGSLTLKDSIVRDNRANGYPGGGILAQDTHFVMIENSQIIDNVANGASGGGLYQDGSDPIHYQPVTLTIRDSVFDNTAINGQGGSIYSSGILSISHSTIDGNASPGSAGAIYKQFGTLQISDSTLSGEAVSGPGILLHDSGDAEIVRSTFVGGQAVYSGGQISNGGTMTLTNSTLSGGRVIQGAGLLFNYGTLTTVNSTLAGGSADPNSPNSGGGSNLVNIGTTTLINTLIATVTEEGIPDCHNSGTLQLTNTLIQDGSCGATLTGDPLIGMLRDNGGATQTHALLTTSPALDVGNSADCPATDQRGEPRSDGACDIGAFEKTDSIPPPAGSCFATPDNGATVFSSDDGSAIQQAVDAAGSVVKIAGQCIGTGGAAQMIFLNTAHTIEGGYAVDDWASADPNTPTILDAIQAGHLIDHRFGSSVVRNFILRNGAGTNGGAVRHSGGVLTLERVQVINSTATNGAGIYATSRLIVRDSTIAENTAVDFGGGIFISATGELTVERSLFLLNKVTSPSSGGAGLYNGNLASILNSTFSGNDARAMSRTRGTGGGGAIFNNGGTLTLRHATIADNFADDNNYPFGGGIHNSNNGILYLHSSIVANNLGGNCVNRARLGANNSNLVNGSRNVSCAGAVSADPRLNLLAENGGRTKTYALSSGSPAIDAVSSDTTCLATDQRGIARPQGVACDIGAFEFDSVPTAVTGLSNATRANSVAWEVMIAFFALSLATIVDISRPQYQKSWGGAGKKAKVLHDKP